MILCLQIEILNLLQMESRHVTVVGDDFQAIYGFRGAQPNVFNRFLEDYNHKLLQQPLQLNYRCHYTTSLLHRLRI